jgi:hypothetical protein
MVSTPLPGNTGSARGFQLMGKQEETEITSCLPTIRGLSKATWKSVNIHECLMNALCKALDSLATAGSIDVNPPCS